MKRLIILACALIVLSGCSDEPCAPDKTSDFEVQVLDSSLYGKPVEGAWIEGGVDWDVYEVRTDANGVALLPARARLTRFTCFHLI